MTGTPPLPPDDAADAGGPAVMAAELALGLLDGDDRAAALRRVLSEPDFAAEVDRWRAHFGLLFDGWPEEAPPANGLARIEAALSPTPTVGNDNGGPRGNGLWKGLAGLSSLAAAALVGVIVLRPAPVPPSPQIVQQAAGPVLVAALVPTDAKSRPSAPIAAVYDVRRGDLRVGSASLADASHSAELWVIPAGSKMAHSLGLLRPGARTALSVSRDNKRRFAAGATIAVTIEAPGGSPDGTPKGPVVVAGSLTQI